MACKKVLTPVKEADTARALLLDEARAEEVASLVALDRECFGRRCWSVRGWWQVVVDPDFTTVVLRDAGEPVGAMVLLSWPPVASLASIGVRATHRNRGLGTLMLHEAIARARRAGARFLTLEVDLANQRARRLYRRAGFGLVRRFKEDGRWRVEMQHRLGARRGR